MKTTGKTNEGDFIVEMTEREHYLLTQLSLVTEGEELNYLSPRSLSGEKIEYDFSTVIGAIIHFVTTKDLVNQMRNKLDEIDKFIMSEEKSEGDKMMDFFKE